MSKSTHFSGQPTRKDSKMDKTASIMDSTTISLFSDLATIIWIILMEYMDFTASLTIPKKTGRECKR